MKKQLMIAVLLLVAMGLSAQTLGGKFSAGLIIDPRSDVWWAGGNKSKVGDVAVDVGVSLGLGETNTVNANFDGSPTEVHVDTVNVVTDWALLMGVEAIGLKSTIGFDSDLVGVFTLAQTSDFVDVTIAGDIDPARAKYKITAANTFGPFAELVSFNAGVWYDTNDKVDWMGLLGFEVGVELTPGPVKFDIDLDEIEFDVGEDPIRNSWNVDVFAHYESLVGVGGELSGTDVELTVLELPVYFDPFDFLGLDAEVFLSLTEADVNVPLRAVDVSVWAKPDVVEYRAGYLWTDSAHEGSEYGPALDNGGLYFVTTVSF